VKESEKYIFRSNSRDLEHKNYFFRVIHVIWSSNFFLMTLSHDLASKRFFSEKSVLREGKKIFLKEFM